MSASQTVAAGQLRAFVERIERVEEEIRKLNADKSEIYKELRGVGFDVKAVRQCVSARKLDSAEREERNAIFDLYWEALTGASRVHVHEEQQIQAPKTRPEAVAKSAAHVDTLVSGKGLAKEPSIADSSGGVQDEEAIHPATNSNSSRTVQTRETDTAGDAFPRASSATISPDPRFSGDDDGHRSIPSSPAAGAKKRGGSDLFRRSGRHQAEYD